MSFPDFNFTPVVDGVDTYQAAHINDLQTAIQATATIAAGSLVLSTLLPAKGGTEVYSMLAVEPIIATGTITSAVYIPAGSWTGEDANYRILTFYHRTAVNGPATAFGILEFTDGVDQVAGVAMPIPWFGTESNRTVTDTEYIYVTNAKVGGSVADAGGLVVITITPS